MSTLIVGDSHANAFVKALRATPVQGLQAIDIRFIADQNAKSKVIPGNIARTHPAKTIYCCIGGTEHNLLGLIETDEKFDFFLSQDDSVDFQRSIIPHQVVRSALQHRLHSLFLRMTELRRHYPGDFIYVAPPPPFRELGETARLPSAFQPHLHMGIVPPQIRMKLYRLRNEIVEEHCRAEGIKFLGAPSEASDSEGFLLTSLWDRDPTHGNAAYGALVLSQIARVDDETAAPL